MKNLSVDENVVKEVFDTFKNPTEEDRKKVSEFEKLLLEEKESHTLNLVSGLDKKMEDPEYKVPFPVLLRAAAEPGNDPEEEWPCMAAAFAATAGNYLMEYGRDEKEVAMGELLIRCALTNPDRKTRAQVFENAKDNTECALSEYNLLVALKQKGSTPLDAVNYEHTTPAVLMTALDHHDVNVRRAAVESDKATPEILLEGLDQPNKKVRYAAVENPNADKSVFDKAEKDPEISEAAKKFRAKNEKREFETPTLPTLEKSVQEIKSNTKIKLQQLAFDFPEFAEILSPKKSSSAPVRAAGLKIA